MQVLETQLQTRRQRELELEQQVAELQTRTAQLNGAVYSAEAVSKQSDQLGRQVGMCAVEAIQDAAGVSAIFIA